VVYLNEGEIEGVGSFDEIRSKIPEFENQVSKMELK
jgi:hypothetical protein